MGKTVIDELSLRRAKKLLHDGMQAVANEAFGAALNCFRESARISPTAEAFTYWGWMEQRHGRLDSAIQLCKRAMDIDPEFGNPYNDIGAYLVSMGKDNEAIPWFQKAVRAKRYEPRQYPHINLGRIYLGQNQFIRALREFEAAREFVPEDLELSELIRTIRDSLH